MALRGTQKAASMLFSIFGMKLVMGPSLMSDCSLCLIQRYLVGNNSRCELRNQKTSYYSTHANQEKRFKQNLFSENPDVITESCLMHW